MQVMWRLNVSEQHPVTTKHKTPFPLGLTWTCSGKLRVLSMGGLTQCLVCRTHWAWIQASCAKPRISCHQTADHCFTGELHRWMSKTFSTASPTHFYPISLSLVSLFWLIFNLCITNRDLIVFFCWVSPKKQHQRCVKPPCCDNPVHAEAALKYTENH